jgi:hypothetical protein
MQRNAVDLSSGATRAAETASPEGPRLPRLSWFRKTLGGIGWLAATPADWLGARSVSRGASQVGRLWSTARGAAVRDRRFKVEDCGVFDLKATAFSYGISVAALEARLASRRSQTAILAYALFGLASMFLAAWLWSALSAPLRGSRLIVALEFLPFCGLFYLLAFYNALINFQIRMGRTAGWSAYLNTSERFFPRG